MPIYLHPKKQDWYAPSSGPIQALVDPQAVMFDIPPVPPVEANNAGIAIASALGMLVFVVGASYVRWPVYSQEGGDAPRTTWPSRSRAM